MFLKYVVDSLLHNIKNSNYISGRISKNATLMIMHCVRFDPKKWTKIDFNKRVGDRQDFNGKAYRYVLV